MERAVFAAGVIKLGEYAKHPGDAFAPQSPDAVEESTHNRQTCAQKLLSITRTGGGAEEGFLRVS